MVKREKLDELVIANEEKAKRDAELVIANVEKAKRADELIIANEEKAKRDAELVIANDEKEKRADELIIANKELVFQNDEKTKHAEELTIAHKELEQLVQLNNDKNLFISILAHDLRSPLGVLLGLSDLLTENIRQFNIDKIEKLVNEINQSAQNTFILLQDLLKWSRVQSGKIPFEPQNLSFTDICKDIIKILNPNAVAKNITIGLLLCKEFVEKHGGKIWVESECGKCSIFYFNIPYNAESKEKNVVLTNSEDNQIKNLKILIVDDNELLRIILYEMVKKFGKEFLYSKTGVESVAACHDNPDIDLILMDFLMPEMDGYEATRQIRLFNKEVVIVVQTAYVLSNENEMAIEAGCNDCISKPINKTLLYELINKHCNK